MSCDLENITKEDLVARINKLEKEKADLEKLNASYLKELTNHRRRKIAKTCGTPYGFLDFVVSECSKGVDNDLEFKDAVEDYLEDHDDLFGFK